MADQQLHDVVDLAGEAPEQAGPAANVDDADVVTLVEGSDGLPDGAALQPDGSVILTLRYPVSVKFRRDGKIVREMDTDKLVLHRLNGAAMRAMMAVGDDQTVLVGLAKSARMAQGEFNGLFDRMDGQDATAATAVLGFFLRGGKSRTSGQPSSP